MRAKVGEACARRAWIATYQPLAALRSAGQEGARHGARGRLGEVVSVDILRGSEYPPFEGGPLPPWYRDAGYPFRDIGVHCLYLIQELLGDIEDVEADWRSLGGDPNLAFDEWRAMVRRKRGLGQFQLTWNTKPMQSQIIIHGTKGVLRVDLFAMFHGKKSSTPLPKAAERLVNAFADLGAAADRRADERARKFARKQIQSYQGLRDLVADFYRRLAAGEPPPVAIEDAAQVVTWVEKVARAADDDQRARLAKFPLAASVPFLVTGANGYLGRATVARLRADGHRVRAFVRRMPDKPPLDRCRHRVRVRQPRRCRRGRPRSGQGAPRS